MHNLDVGDYSTEPIHGLGAAKTRELGSLIESHRLADYVIGPWEADPQLTRHSYQVALDGGSSVNAVLPGRISGAALRHRYVAGFMSHRDNDVGGSLENAVVVFPDTSAAKAALQELIELTATDPELSSAVPIPGHPDVATYIQKSVNDCCRSPRSMDHLLAFSLRSRYILVQNAWFPDDPDLSTAASLVRKAIDLQGPLIDTFTPTPESQLAELLVDPTGLLARTVPVSAAGSSSTDRAVYGLRGTLHFQFDPILSKEAFRKAALVQSAFAAAQVYETRTSGGAQLIAETFYDEASHDGVPRGGVDGIPDSSCVSSISGSDEHLYCVTYVGKYMIEVSSHESNAKQVLAAQYLLLKNP
ncbi:DUF7373 family lipoprotein [Mycolicibacterium vaccae]|uniref:DUF7373 family lipoprotein n=1 Tax=Mycolicibacterium vaccae TaxID=1810 RepID=UPI003D0362C6